MTLSKFSRLVFPSSLALRYQIDIRSAITCNLQLLLFIYYNFCIPGSPGVRNDDSFAIRGILPLLKETRHRITCSLVYHGTDVSYAFLDETVNSVVENSTLAEIIQKPVSSPDNSIFCNHGFVARPSLSLGLLPHEDN